jgi:hypothetical protein
MAKDCVEKARFDLCAKRELRVAPILNEDRLTQLVFWHDVIISEVQSGLDVSEIYTR